MGRDIQTRFRNPESGQIPGEHRTRYEKTKLQFRRNGHWFAAPPFEQFENPPS
jgi:hypothetical protein